MIEIGSKLGDYVILSPLGAGGAGSVFRALNKATGKEVALKTMLSASVVNEEIHSRFVREISIAQKLTHPNIIAYDDCGFEEGTLFYTMELVPWGSLSEVLAAKHRLNWRDAAECGIQICRGLEHLHDANIVHRDLKPANIFLSDDGELKLGDFGLARDLGSHRLTTDGTTVGTAKYLAPEQAKASVSLDGRTDLYSLGCLLFEMLCGRVPFDADASYSQASYFEVMKRHVEEPPPALGELVTDVPPPMVNLVMSMLEKEPENRPASAKEVQQCLSAFLEGEVSAAVTSDSVSVDDNEEEAESLTARLHSGTLQQDEVNWAVLATVATVIIVIAVLAALNR